MMKVLAFFGAFNPPTVAHIDLAKYALDQTDADKVIFVPSKSSYISGVQRKDYAFSDSERLEMLNVAAALRPWMLVSGIEICRETQPRTYDTLCALRELGFAPSLLLGSDKLPELEKGWKHIDEISKEFGIICLCRGNDNCERMISENKYLSTISKYIRIVKTPEDMHFISSTAVRHDIMDNGILDETGSMLTKEVLEIALRSVKKENDDET